MKCTECGGTVSDSAQQCPHCGAPITKCPGCGKLIPVGHDECPYCGTPAPKVVERIAGRPDRPSGMHYRTSGQEPQESFYEGPRRRISVGAVVVLAILLLLIISCPGESKHEQVVKERISGAVNDLRDSAGLGTGMKALTNEFVDQVTKVLFANNFDVDKYLLFSVGKIHFDGKSSVVTIGLANHVFCLFSKDDIKRLVVKWKARQQQRVDNVFDLFRRIFGFDDGLAPDNPSDDNSDSPLDDFFGNDGTDDTPDDVAPDTDPDQGESDLPEPGSDDRTI